MDRFKSIFKREQQATGTGGQQSLNRSTNLSVNNGSAIPNGQSDSDSQSDAEGFLCPTCMQSFANPDLLQQHFAVAHAEPIKQVPADKELELLRLQLTASEESRSLLSTELIHMQKQMQEMAANQPEQPPDLSPEIKRLETQIQLMQIENTELVEKNQLLDKGTQQLQESLTVAVQEQKTVENSLSTEREKYNLVCEQLTQEKLRSNSVTEESKRLSEQLRKSEVSLEQLRLAAGKTDETVAKLAGKEELCRNLEQQINEHKQNSIKQESEIAQHKKTLDTKEETIKRNMTMHEEMKTATDSKIQSMKELIQEKTTSLDRTLADNEQLQHKVHTLETKLGDNQSELTEATKKYDDLHQNFVQKIDAGEGTNVIVTQLKEDSARIQEKLKHSEEKLQTEKEETYQKLRAAEATQKDLELKLSAVSTESEELKTDKNSLEKDKQDLKSDYEQQLSSLQSEQATLVNELKSTITSHEETILKLNTDISTKIEEKEQLTSTLQKNSGEVSSLEQQLSELKQTVSQLETSNEGLTQQISKQTEELSSLGTVNDDLQKQLSEKGEEVTQLKGQLDTATRQQQELSGNNELQVSSLTERINNLELDLKTSEDLLQEKLSALDQLQEDSAVLNERILELKETLTFTETEKNKLQEDNVDLQTLITNLEMAKLELGRETERLQNQTDSNSSQVSLLSAELEKSKQLTMERDANILVLRQQLETRTKEGESLQSSLLEQIDQMATAAKQADVAKKAEISKNHIEIEDMNNKIKKQSETNAALSREHAATLDQLSTAEVRLNSLQTAYDASMAQVESLKKQMDKKSDDHGHVLQETTEILQRTSDENEALTRALTELKTEMSVVEEQLLNAQKNSDDWQSQHRLLQDDIEAVKQALLQEKTTSEETKQLLISNKLQMQNKYEIIEEEKLKLAKEIKELATERDNTEEKAQDNLRILEGALATEKSKMEEAEARSNMQLVSLTENLALNKTDLTATQEKLMDVVKHNDELRGFNIELETKLEASNDERNMLWNRCMTSETETTALRDEKEELKSQIENLNSALHELGRENQSLQIKTTKAQTRRWVEDDDVLDCTNCAKSFNVRVRKHHCRNCGNIFCHECSSKQLQLPVSSKPSRVCDNCHTELKR